MICKSGWSKEQGRGLIPTGNHNAEVASTGFDELLLFICHNNLNSAQVLDNLALLYVSASCDCCFLSDDCVSVGGRDLEGTVWQVDVDVFAQMPSEIILLLVGLETIGELL
jgi:hypothetical protein